MKMASDEQKIDNFMTRERKIMEEIKDYELEYPELRLITEEHKIKFFNALNSTKDKKEMITNCDLAIDEISKDIKFTGDKFILSSVMSIHMLSGFRNLIDSFGKLDI
jgi:hypothetical protein